jgi:WD40 repeat protein
MWGATAFCAADQRRFTKSVAGVVVGLMFACLVAVTWHPIMAEDAHQNGKLSRIIPITVQPNLGEIDTTGGVAFAPNDKYLAIGNRNQIKLWEIASGRSLRILEHTAYFEHFIFIDGGTRILSVHKDGEARIWDSLTGQMLSSTKIDGIEVADQIMALSHDAARNAVVIVPWGGSVIVWDYKKKVTRGKFVFDSGKDNPQSAYGAMLSTDHRRLIAAGGAMVKWFDLVTRKPITTVALRADLRVVPSGVIEEGLVIAKTADEDCDADLVLVILADPVPHYATLDSAPGCKKRPDGMLDRKDYRNIVLIHNKTKRQLFITRRGTESSKILDLGGMAPGATSLPLREVKGSIEAVDTGASLAALAEGNGLRIVNLSDGSRISRLQGTTAGMSPIASADGNFMMLHHTDRGAEKIWVWPVNGVAPTFYQVRLPAGFSARDILPDANLLLGDDGRGRFVVHSTQTGTRVASFTVKGLQEVVSAKLSPGGKYVMIDARLQQRADSTPDSDFLPAAYLIETSTSRVIRAFQRRKAEPPGGVFDDDFVRSFAFTADEQLLALGWLNGTVEVWGVQQPSMIKSLESAGDQMTSLTFSPDKRYLVGGSRDSGVFVWSLDSGKLMQALERTSLAGHVSTGSVSISEDSELIAAGPRQRATSTGDVGQERRVQVWDLATGKQRFLLSGHEANVTALLFTNERRWIVSGSDDGTIRYWDRRTGKLGATFAVAPDGSWVMITDKGFFAASAGAGGLLSIVRGFEATSIEQTWQSLYAPDLVREYLGGDPSGELKLAVANVDLQKVLDSGPAPDVAILQPATSEATTQDLLTVTARITDKGHGIGRIEWRVNGVTAAVATKPTGKGPNYVEAQQLALDLGDNTMEVVAYNAGNLLASLPARATIKFTGTADAAKPTLHVLAIGINAYHDLGWTPPGSAETLAFPPLNLAVSDAKALATTFKQAAVGQYAKAKIIEALDTDATAAGLQQIIDRMAPEIHPRDTFVMFAAAHGSSHDGRYYLIPQDYNGGTNPDALQQRAISQDLLQDWLANRIKAKRAILLLDTCESGALVGGYTRSRIDVPASEAAIGRLHEATGRPVLTAAAEGKPAFEGYEGHGVFTWALLDALKNADRNGNGSIELSELVAHVQDQVPKIATKLNGRGLVAIGVQGSTDYRQSAHFGSRGEDYVVVRRLQ